METLFKSATKMRNIGRKKSILFSIFDGFVILEMNGFYGLSSHLLFLISLILLRPVSASRSKDMLLHFICFVLENKARVSEKEEEKKKTGIIRDV